MSMLGSLVIGTSPMAQTHSAGPQHKLPGSRLIARVGLSISLCLAVTLVGPRLAAYQTSGQVPDCPPAQGLTNLVFMIDRSGSMQNKIEGPQEGTSSPGRGQTYTVQIEGVRRALTDASVIPRDGSVSIGMVLFDGGAFVALPLSPPIISDDQANTIALKLNDFLCSDLDSQISPCPAGNTDFAAAITLAEQIASSPKDRRRVLIMSTDGEPTDPDRGRSASASARENASKAGVDAELDVILIGLPVGEIENTAKQIVNDLVFPPPKTVPPSAIDMELPGAVEIISKKACNEPDADFDATCECQVAQFADFTRRALRSNIASRDLTVTTAADTDPNTPVLAGGPLSLRQAIETANANSGRTTITFGFIMTIRPSQALPPLTAPDITICGCTAGCSTASIPDKLTCSQTSQSKTNVCDRKVTIDGQFHLDDGIVIRSNRDVVRGLIITRFRHAGVVIQSVCPSDNTGFNRIEHNTLEDNTKAGVCVLDPPTGQANGVTHNIGNTISENDILGSETPIDLGSAAPFSPGEPFSVCDGPTPNDVGDLDEGPNHLINFPDELTAETTGDTVTITGKANGPGAPGSTVEIFAVQQFEPSSGGTMVTSVTFFKSVPADQNGLFSVSGVSASPILGYTATVTDIEGNTSELRTSCSGPALAALEPSLIRFARIDPSGTAPSNRQFSDFTIFNRGCSKLDATVSIKRAGADAASIVGGDCVFFPLQSLGSLFLSKGSDAAPEQCLAVSIPPGGLERFQVGFAPVIPRVVTKAMEEPGERLLAKDVLPKKVKSDITLKANGRILQPSVRLIGRVTTKVKLIDPVTTSNPAKVTLERSGDNLTVTFSVFDSDLDVSTVNYEFFRIQSNQCLTSSPVRAEIVDPDLTKVIMDRKLLTGQSFTVIQRFSGALDNPEAGCVRVTVSDGAPTPPSATSLPASGSQSLGKPSEFRDLSRSRGATIVRPTIKLPNAASNTDKTSGAGEAQSRIPARRNR